MKLLLVCVLSLLLAEAGLSQPVIVTAQLDTNRVGVGASTRLHVFAQIAPENRAGSARIFSWNVDVIAGGASLAQFDAAGLIRPASDNDPQTSSSGAVDGANLRSIRDSFLNAINAGHDAPIELFSVPIQALSPGPVSIALQPGSLTEEPDFVLDPIGDGPTLTGGDYRQAQVQLDIVAPLTNFLASITQNLLPANAGRLVTISFATTDTYSYSVEYATNLTGTLNWLPLPNAPHAGFADDTNAVPQRFYRVRAISL